MKIWLTLSLITIILTLILQMFNFYKFGADGQNTTRIVLIAKELFFLAHLMMLINGQIFGVYYFLGLACLFYIYAKNYVWK